MAFETVGFLLTLYGLDKAWRFGDGAGAISTLGRLVRAGGRIVVVLSVRPLRWLRRRASALFGHQPPEVRVVPITANVSATAGVTATLTATATGTVTSPVEERLDLLERQFKALADETALEREASRCAASWTPSALSVRPATRERTARSRSSPAAGSKWRWRAFCSSSSPQSPPDCRLAPRT